MLRTAEALRDRGYVAELVVCERRGPLLSQVPSDIPVIDLPPAPMAVARLWAAVADPAGLRELLKPILLAPKPPHRLAHLPALVRYLRRARPDGLLAALPTPNMLAVWGRRLARVPTRVAVTHRNALSEVIGDSRKWRKRHLPALLHRTYLTADAIIAVSDGVADDLAACTGITRERISTVYNPVVGPDLFSKASAAVSHPWMAADAPPMLLGVGALTPQKDFPTLVRAFAHVRSLRRCRLMILGQAKSPAETAAQQAELMDLARALGIAADVCLPGFVENPFAYMARAAVFVLSSRYEGLPGVLIQALACGCPVVSTDCPHGPGEILEGGRFGELVPVGSARALGDAIVRALDAPLERARLRERARVFSVERAVERYLELLLPPLDRPPV